MENKKKKKKIEGAYLSVYYHFQITTSTFALLNGNVKHVPQIRPAKCRESNTTNKD